MAGIVNMSKGSLKKTSMLRHGFLQLTRTCVDLNSRRGLHATCDQPASGRHADLLNSVLQLLSSGALLDNI